LATYSLGTSIKINAAISTGQSATSNATASYTAPANSYAIVQVFVSLNPGGSYFATIAGNPILSGGSAGVLSFTSTGYYVGPGHTLSLSTTSATSAAIISGVEFKNSP
jgi:hypothetical protein